MEYPILNVKQKSRQMTDAFLGYNHNLRINESEFYDMKNMTSDYYPVLAPRKKRGEYNGDLTEINGMIAKDKLYFVDGPDFRIDDDIVYMDLSTQEYDLPKKLISMGSYVIVMPDRKWVNTIKKHDVYEHGSIDQVNEVSEEVEFSLCTLTGETYEGAEESDTAPDATDGKLWIDTSSEPHTLKKYSTANKMWVSIPTTYIKIEAAGLSYGFNKYDGVKISGITEKGATDLNGYHTIWDCDSQGDNFIIVVGMIDKVVKQTSGTITISRKMPVMDHLIECNNRLWGCRYGANEDGDIVNEIYASKLGDFKNWNCFMGLSTDSYTASCGTDGPFTGAITHLGYPLFFKENYVHKVYGNLPSNFQIQTTACRGVQNGSHGSLAIVNETLYYKSANAVCAYDGSLPVEISSDLGDVRYYHAVACAHGNKYYISMSEDLAGDNYRLFVYDTSKGVWHKEDDFRVGIFCPYKDEIYAVRYEDDRLSKITTLLGSGEKYEDKVPWMVETGLIGMSMPDMKYISKLLIRMSLEVGASAAISIQYDSIGDWEKVYEMTVTSLRSFAVPIRLRRCDHFRIRIDGLGECRIYSITKTIEQGSDVS